MSILMFEDQDSALAALQGSWYDGSEQITIAIDGSYSQSTWIRGRYVTMATGSMSYDLSSGQYTGHDTWSLDEELEEFTFWFDTVEPPTASSMVIHTPEEQPFTLTAQQPVIPFATPGLYDSFNGASLSMSLWDSWNWESNGTTYIIDGGALQATVGPETNWNSAGMNLDMSVGYLACVMTVDPVDAQGDAWFDLGSDLGSDRDGWGFSVSIGIQVHDGWYQIQANASQQVEEEQWEGVWNYSRPLPGDPASNLAWRLGMELDEEAGVVRFYVDDAPFATYTVPEEIALDPYHDFFYYLGSDTGARFDIRDVWVGDTVSEAMGRIRRATSYTLASNQFDLTLTGTGAINGVGNGRDNHLTGNGAANTLEGRSGNDLLDGRGGADILIGGSGDDWYVVDTVNDQVQESSGGGIDGVRSPISWVLADHVEQLELTGTAPIQGTGNSLHNTITGNEANNLIDGGTGSDLMIGGAGNDTYVVNSSGDMVQERSGGGTDTVKSAVSWTLGRYVEKLTLTGSGAIQGTGNSTANTLTGNSAANTLNGGGGDDRLIGGGGSDRLTGGSGADRFQYTASNQGGDTITDFSAAAGDRLLFASANFGPLAAGPLGSGRLLNTATGRATTTTQRFVFNTSTRQLRYDADGTGPSAAVPIATLSGVSSLSAHAILIV